MRYGTLPQDKTVGDENGGLQINCFEVFNCNSSGREDRQKYSVSILRSKYNIGVSFYTEENNPLL